MAKSPCGNALPTFTVEPIWSRQPGEPSLWFGRFQRWLLMPRRNLTELYRQERQSERQSGRKESKKAASRQLEPPGSWRQAVQKWRWGDRADAFDGMQHQRLQQEWEEWRRAWIVANTRKLIEEHAAIAFSDITTLFDTGFNPKRPELWDEHTRRAIASISLSSNADGAATLSIKFHAKHQSLAALMKFAGIADIAMEERLNQLEERLNQVLEQSRKGTDSAGQDELPNEFFDE